MCVRTTSRMKGSLTASTQQQQLEHAAATLVTLPQVALVNLCVGAAFLGGVPSASPRLMGLFSLSPVAKSLFAQDVILYLPQSNIAFSAYQALVALLPWPAGEAQRTGRSCSLGALQSWRAGALEARLPPAPCGRSAGRDGALVPRAAGEPQPGHKDARARDRGAQHGDGRHVRGHLHIPGERPLGRVLGWAALAW